MNVLHHHLEAVEASGLGDLNLGGEPLSEVLEDNTIRCGEEGEDVFDEMLFILGESLPVLDVLGQVHLLSSPERGLLVLVHLPDVVILNGEEHEPVRVLFEEGLWQRPLSLTVTGVLL